MLPQTSLEQSIRESYALIHDYEQIIQTSPDPKEKARCQRVIGEQQALIRGYLADYRCIVGAALPTDIAQIAATLDTSPTPPGPQTGGPGLARALAMARRTLDVLEGQAAAYTALTIPAHLQIELEEQRAKVTDLEKRTRGG